MYSLIIVDDEAAIRDGIIHLFPWEKVGFTITGEFSNGRDALIYLREHPVDVVLTDIQMPVMTGIELSNSLANDFPDIKFIFLTGYHDFSYMHAAITNHASEYLLKPIKYDTLYNCFEKLRSELDHKYKVIPDNQGQSYYEKILSTVLDYINQDYQNATLDHAAVLVTLSPNYLSKLIKEKSRKSFSEHLYEVRMKKAAEMLKDIHYKHYEIAYYLGYDNPKNFSRAFKQYYNMTPRQYREEQNL